MVATDVPVTAPPTRRRRRRARPTTVAATVVLAASAVAALVVGQRSTPAPAAAIVGPDRIAASSVEREVATLEAEPAYAAALRDATTTALVAPVAPNFVAAPDGDPDDLRITAGAPAGTRPLTRADVDAEVLTRLLYLTALRQQLAAERVTPDAAELLDGAQAARADAGADASGRAVYDRLPGWYRNELATRAADVEALVRGLAGAGAVTDAEVAAAYDRQAATQFTTVCLTSRVGSGPVRDDGCAPMSGWATDVAAAVASTPVGSTATVERSGRSAVLVVTRRATAPLADVAGVVRAGLLARYAGLVDQAVEGRLGLDRVTVASRYGTYQSSPGSHQVLPPDALAPAAPSTTAPPTGPTTTTPHGQLDPFD